MKNILVPIRVFETGDRVFSSEGLATVIHDEMEDFEKEYSSVLSCSLESKAVEDAILASNFRGGVTVKLDYATSKYPNKDFTEGRESLIPLKIYKERPQACSCGCTDLEDESTDHFAQRLWTCPCGRMFLVDPNHKE